VRQDGRVEVYIDGGLLASYEEGETGIRNVLLVMLAKKEAVVLEKLAQAFRITSETLRQIRRLHEAEGLEAVVDRIRRGPKPKVTAALRRRMEALFEQGLSISAVHARIRGRVSLSSVGAVRLQWAKARGQTAPSEPQQQVLVSVQVTPGEATESGATVARVTGTGSEAPTSPGGADVAAGQAADDAAQLPEAEGAGLVIRAPRTRTDESSRELRAATSAADAPALAEPDACLTPEGEPISRRGVQFLGAWLLVAMVARSGLYEHVLARLPAGMSARSARLALDGVLIALAAGQRCVEGVRRLATRGAAALLMAGAAPSPDWARKVLARLSEGRAAEAIHWGYGADLVRAAAACREAGRPVVFFVDNHQRPYTGKRRLMYGWRMQDKRPRPGTSDYYVHDRRGQPLVRVNVPSHGSLSQYLLPLAVLLEIALEDGVRLLVAFDRGASFPEVMAELRRCKHLEFVTYERAPYRKMPAALFKMRGQRIEVEGDRADEVVTLYLLEDRCNLGDGRGGVRRIRVLNPDGSQINVLAKSKEDAEWLVRTIFDRWCQENGFKHGVERWGVNQLDGRKVKSYSPDKIIFNPDKRRLLRELEELRDHEGTLRRALARTKNGPVRVALKEELRTTMAQLARLEARCRSRPDHVAVKDAKVPDLVYHPDNYKMLLDTLRIASCQAEAQLARLLAPHLRRPREAKRALRNLFSAAGDVVVRADAILVRLDPAGTNNEKRGFAKILATINRMHLSHPGDPRHRPLRFKTQLR